MHLLRQRPSRYIRATAAATIPRTQAQAVNRDMLDTQQRAFQVSQAMLRGCEQQHHDKAQNADLNDATRVMRAMSSGKLFTGISWARSPPLPLCRPRSPSKFSSQSCLD